MSMIIVGIGTSLPQHRISQHDAAEIAKQYSCETASQERLFLALYRRAGVAGRNTVVLDRSDGPLAGRQSFYTSTSPTTLDRMRKYEEAAGELAAAAAGAAIRDAGIVSSRITHLVTVSCSGFSAPGFDLALLKRLSLSPGTARTHIGFMGCQGALNGLRVSRAFLDADPAACVLLCALELCSLHHQYDWDSEKIVANALFADGAAAAVGFSGERTKTGLYQIIDSGSLVVADSEDVMSWRIGNTGFEMTLSPRLPDLICLHLRPWLEQWLGENNLDIAGIGSWAVHPGGPRILSAFCEATGLARSALEVSFQVLAEQGNMSSPTILFILDRLRRCRTAKPCVALAFGPGLTIEATLLR
jgi:predicted naringenin-chalcone synthase